MGLFDDWIIVFASNLSLDADQVGWLAAYLTAQGQFILVKELVVGAAYDVARNLILVLSTVICICQIVAHHAAIGGRIAMKGLMVGLDNVILSLILLSHRFIVARFSIIL